MGRNKLPEGTKRVRIFGRVNPTTVDFFKSLGEINDGRAMDKTVHLARGMQRALERLGDHVNSGKDYHGTHCLALGMQKALGYLEEQHIVGQPSHVIGSAASALS
jgi:hypothetical protein